MGDFIAFRTMVTTIIIQTLFWIGTILCFIVGLMMIIMGNTEGNQVQYLGPGVLLLVLGPVGVRIFCEILVVFFRINQTLTEIKHAMERPATPPTLPEAA